MCLPLSWSKLLVLSAWSQMTSGLGMIIPLFLQRPRILSFLLCILNYCDFYLLAICRFFSVSVNSVKLKTKIMPIIISCYSIKWYKNSRRVIIIKGLSKCHTSKTLCDNFFPGRRKLIRKMKNCWLEESFVLYFIKKYTISVSLGRWECSGGRWWWRLHKVNVLYLMYT